MTAAETIAKALGGHKTGNGWIARCPLHDDQNAEPFDQRRAKMARCWCIAMPAAISATFTLPSCATAVFSGNTSAKIPSPTKKTPDADARKRSAFALAIWRACGPAEATLVQTYLAARGIDLPLPNALRFHAGLKHPSGDIWPAMVALVTNGVDATPLAIHRTFLARDGSSKAPVDPQKMMLGPCRGGVVRLGDLRGAGAADAADADPSGRPPATSSSGGVLMVGEGIETCLAAMQATGHPAWAALSTAGLRALDLPEDVRDVIVLADGDAAGEAAARDCAWRWKRQGRRVRIARPPQGTDFNDMLMAGAGQ